MADPVIEGLQRTQLGEAAVMLARAFDDSPIFEYLFPDGPSRARIITGFFRSVCSDALPFGNVYVAVEDQRIIGAACWYAPGRYPPSKLRQLRQFATVLALGRHAPSRMRFALAYLNATEKVHPKNEHWYLAILGVEPDRQGQGIGARLIDHTLDPLDREGLDAYLETDKESNLAWYARRRFELRETLHPTPDGPPTWTMWRDAR
jgi:GNAT superfamily N-acetyltransferase